MNLFRAELILFNVSADNCEELLKKLAGILIEGRYVKESFAAALWEREQAFPTGLPTSGVQVAIPHTSAGHVIKPVVLLANLAHPVIFKEMGNGIQDIRAELVFLLALNKSHEQIQLLQKLMGIFTKKEVLMALKQATDAATTLKILEQQFA